MYSSLLVPLDGSGFSEHALPIAAELAARTGAIVTLGLVHTPLVLPTGDLEPVSALGTWEPAHREQELEYLERQAERLRQRGLTVEAEIRDGDVARELTKLAESADLVVMATHGRGGLARAWLGSVADAVVRHAAVPVLLIRPDDDEGGATPPPADFSAPRRILAATDGSDAASAAVEEAAELARLFGARLILLRVVAFPGGLASPYIPHAAQMDREAVEEGVAAARESLAAIAGRLTELEVETDVAQAFHPARGILTAVEEHGADLVAVGTHRRTALGRAVLGGTADKVIRASSVPVLVGHAAD